MNKKIILALTTVVMLFACSKKNEVTTIPVKTDSTGLYILTEGGFGNNDAALSFYNNISNQLSLNLFASVNQRNLGDVANDIAIYGNKLYIVVNNSNNVEILDLHTAKSLATIHVDDIQPRHIAFYNGKAYVTTYAGKLLVIDTATNALTQQADIEAGSEGIVQANNKFYISVPGVFPKNDQVILSVRDAATLKEITTLKVDPNPNQVFADQYNHLFVVCNGLYGGKSSLATIDLTTDKVTSVDQTVQLDNMAIYNNHAYLYKSTYEDDSKQPVQVYDVKEGKLQSGNFITDGTTISYYYGIATDPANGDVYVIDALNNKSSQAKVICFDSNGKTKFTINLRDYGAFASKIVFVR